MRECEWSGKIFNLKEEEFEGLALEAFHFQSVHCRVYREYLSALGIDPKTVTNFRSIPFLPIQVFKSHRVFSGEGDAELIFESSGTTGSINSKHFVKSAALYQRSFEEGFRLRYGKPEDYCFLGLLPSYLERSNSSLLHMVRGLMEHSGHAENGFFLSDFQALNNRITALQAANQPTILIGVSFALLDFAAQYPRPLRNTIVIETGGMKGRKREMIREELHGTLQSAWSLPSIHSEYGMTELLSQAYARNDGKLSCPPWMRAFLRDEEDPLAWSSPSTQTRSGALNIIDLANIYSCSFIATDDLVRLAADGTFEVQGRLDASDIRGCSLMAAWPAVFR